jgi:hypothetical protein
MEIYRENSVNFFNHTNIQAILDDFNTLHPKLHFTAEAERDHTISYLNISIHRTPTSIMTSIYKKPTFTDTIIPYTSNQPTNHKYAAVKFPFNRLNSYDLQQEEYRQELNIIHNILHNSSFSIIPQNPPIHTPRHKQITKTPRKKWTILTYVGKETFCITNLLRRTDFKIAFRTNNTIGNLLSHTKPAPDKFSLSGVYKLTCPDCNKAYVGQTGRPFTTRQNEHKVAFRNNSHSPSFAKHLYEEAQSFGPIENLMQVLHYHRKGAHLNKFEKFYIHAEFTANNHLNDNQTIFPKAIFDVLLNTHRP